MKEEDAHVEGGHRLVMYVEKDDHTYGPVETGSYLVENYIDDLREKRSNLKQNCMARLRSGEISPIGYYALLIEIGDGDLARRVGVSRRSVRKHMTPNGFRTLSVEHVRRYAEVFGVPVANMFQVVSTGDGVEVRQEETLSPLVVTTHAARGDG